MCGLAELFDGSPAWLTTAILALGIVSPVTGTPFLQDGRDVFDAPNSEKRSFPRFQTILLPAIIAAAETQGAPGVRLGALKAFVEAEPIT